MMKRFAISFLFVSFSILLVSSCSWLMEPQERERVPQPPPGPEKSALPHNKTQRFEAEATLGRWPRRDVNGIRMTLDGDSVLYSIRQTGYNRLRFPSGEMAELV